MCSHFTPARNSVPQYSTHDDLNSYEFPTQQPLDDNFFDLDFLLFDSAELGGESVLEEVPSAGTSINASACSSFSEDQFVFNDAIEKLLPTPSPTISPHLAPSPDASGSEGPLSSHASPLLKTSPTSGPSFARSGIITPPATDRLPAVQTDFHLPNFAAFNTRSSTSPSTPASSIISSSGRKRKASELSTPRPKELVETEIHSDDDEKDVRRKRNTAAARRYRQKKQDRMKELEEELDVAKKEIEQWKLEAQRQQMEAEKWKQMFELMKGSMGK